MTKAFGWLVVVLCASSSLSAALVRIVALSPHGRDAYPAQSPSFDASPARICRSVELLTR
jgi:hypothetical protein